MKNKKLTFLGLAEKVLREVNKPMTPNEIWSYAEKKGWIEEIKTEGRTPLNTLSRDIHKYSEKPNSNITKLKTKPASFILKSSAVSIERLHEELYNSLREHFPSKPYYLRHTDAHERLSKGYWFWGNDDYLTFTCWKATDKKNNSRNIAIYVDKDGSCTLKFSATDDENKAKVLKTIATILPNMKQLKWAGEEVAMWEKQYEGGDYLAHIQSFLAEDKPKIDAILGLASAEVVESFQAVTQAEFEGYVQQIEAYRNASNEPDVIEIQKEDTNFLRLQQLSIENIGIFPSLTLEFSPHVTVLIGENGIGKTTILRAIAIALAGINENSLMDTQHPKIQQLLRIESQSKMAEKGFISLQYQYQEKDCKNQILLENEQYGVRIEDDNTSDFVSVVNDEFPNLVIGFSQVPNGETPFYMRKIRPEALMRIKNPHIKDVLPLIYNQADNRFQSFSEWIIQLYNQGNDERKGEEMPHHHQLVHIVFEVISNILDTPIEFIKVILPQNKIWIKDIARNQDISLDLISQGFNSIFGWVGYLMMRLYEIRNTFDSSDNGYLSNFITDYWQQHAIVLIDEIDTYLHPKWQRTILKVLADKFPNIQFVVTTHSPLVLSSLDNKQTLAYRITKEGAEAIPHFYGSRIQDLIYREYGIKERSASEVQEKINQLFDAIDEDNKQIYEPLYQELLVTLGEDDPAILDAQLLLEEKEAV